MKIKIRRSNFLDIFVILFLASETLRIVIGNIIGRLGLSDYTGSVVAFIVFIPLVFHLLMSKRLNTNLVKACFLVFLVGMFFFATYVLHPSYAQWFGRKTYGVWDEIFSPISGSIFTIFIFSLVTDYDRLYKDFKWIAYLRFFACFYQVYVAITRGYWESYNASGEIIESTYNVDFGYKAAFVAVFLMILFLMEKDKRTRYLHLGCSVLAAIWLITCGSRGSIVAYGVGIILMVGFKIRSMPKGKQVFIWLSSCSLVFVIGLFYEVILAAIVSLLSSLNVASRTVEMFLSGGFFDQNGRDYITAYAIEIIQNQGLLGSGAYGDRPVIGPVYYWGYCHNLFLEFLVDFGVIFGSLFLLLLLYACVKYYLNCKTWTQVGLFIAIFSVNVKLMFSDTFWGFEFFWLLIGFLIFQHSGHGKRRIVMKRNHRGLMEGGSSRVMCDYLVTVCCLAYNHGQTIRRTLDSILAQKTNFPFEIIVHADASSDDTASIIREYEASYPTIAKGIY